MPTTYMMFGNLPYDFLQGAQLPLDLGNGVKLDDPAGARVAIFSPENPGLFEAVVQDEAIGLGTVHVCLSKSHSANANISRIQADLCYALLALRLVKPFAFRASGLLTVDGSQVSSVSTFHYSSSVSFAQAGPFDDDVVAKARRVNTRISAMRSRSLDRIRSSITIFDHASNGHCRSWQLCVLGHFAALECMFPQPSRSSAKTLKLPTETYGERLARRATQFLLRGRFFRSQRKWLESQYNKFRNPLAHGIHAAPMGRVSLVSNREVLLRIHDICRLAILGMIGSSDAVLARALPVRADGAGAQRAIESLGPASMTYLTGQQSYF